VRVAHCRSGWVRFSIAHSNSLVLGPKLPRRLPSQVRILPSQPSAAYPSGQRRVTHTNAISKRGVTNKGCSLMGERHRRQEIPVRIRTARFSPLQPQIEC